MRARVSCMEVDAMVASLACLSLSKPGSAIPVHSGPVERNGASKQVTTDCQQHCVVMQQMASQACHCHTLCNTIHVPLYHKLRKTVSEQVQFR